MDSNAEVVTKLCRPRVVNSLNRNRLFKILDNEISLTLIHGPAGSGKTTTASTYIEDRELRCLWYQLDSGDSDPATFFYYLGHAVSVQNEEANSILPSFTPEFIPGADVFSRRYFEKIGALIKGPAIIVFDNYQSIDVDSALHHLIDLGIAHLPHGFRTFVLSRAALPQAFARRKSSCQMQSILWEDLKLDFEETSSILDLRATAPVSEQVREQIHRKCEGWAAGISLMCQAISTTPIRCELVGRAPEEIFDYFAEEVFGVTDDETRNFLIKTSFFSDMTAEQASALTANKKAAEILFNLLKWNFFISQPDKNGRTFRYHSLFREFLQSKAEIYLTAEEMARTRNMAAKLLDKSGNMEEAISLYLASNDFDSAIEAIEKNACYLIAQGRNKLVLSLLAELPEGLRKSNHWLLYWQGTAAIAFDPLSSSQLFEDAFKLSIEKQDRLCKLSSFAGILDSIFYEGTDFKKFDKWLDKLDDIWPAVNACHDTNIQFKALDSIVTAVNLRRPQYSDIDFWIEHFLTIQAPLQNCRVVSYALCQIGWFLALHRADHAKSLVLIDNSKLLEKNYPVSPVQILHRSVSEAAIYLLSGDTEKCTGFIDEALHLSDESGVRLFDFMLMGHKISNYLNLGDVSSARKLLRKIENWHIALRPWDKSYLHFLKAREALISNNLNEAFVHAGIQKKLEDKIGSTIGIMLVRTNLAQICYAKGKTAEANQYLEELENLSEEYESESFKFYSLFLKAQFALAEGDISVAKALLQNAAERATELGYINTFVDSPQALANLCVFALENSIGVEYFQFLVRNRKLVPANPPIHLENWPWPLKIFTLGRFEIEKDGQPVLFNGKTQLMPLRLLKLIIALGGTDIPEEQLSDILWPETDGYSAHRAFSTTIYRLRQLLDIPHLIKIADGKVTLNRGLCFVDAWAYDHWAHQLLSCQDNFPELFNSQQNGNDREKAISRYSGSFLTSDNWGAPIIAERERLRDIYIKLIREVGNYFEKNKQWSDAIWHYKRGLAVDEFAELFYQRLMICYANEGQSSEAMNIYERCQKIFKLSFGLEPSQKTKEIRCMLKNRSL